jgi:hypothetical protein
MAVVQKKKTANKHGSNLRRIDRKYKRWAGTPSQNKKRKPEQGKCGSSYCTKSTGCKPWK